jgi:tetratricopeptide (TPR) repeat protein
LCYYNIGNSLFARGEYKKAIHCWSKTAELEPTHPQINYRIAQAYWSDGDWERARECFLAEVRRNPGDVDIILDFGLFLLEVGDMESAQEKFNRILELKPDSATALFYRGEIAFSGADYEQAARLFNQTLQKDTALKGPRYRLAQYALMRGRKEEARDYLLAELKLDPEDPDTLVSMGSMFLTICEPDYAIHCLLRAVDADCASANAYYYLGLVSAIRGRLNDAAEFFEHVLDISPKDIRTLKDCAVVYMAMGRLADAAERIKKAKPLVGGDRQLDALERKVRLAWMTQRIVDFFWQLQHRIISGFVNKFRRSAGA